MHMIRKGSTTSHSTSNIQWVPLSWCTLRARAARSNKKEKVGAEYAPLREVLLRTVALQLLHLVGLQGFRRKVPGNTYGEGYDRKFKEAISLYEVDAVRYALFLSFQKTCIAASFSPRYPSKMNLEVQVVWSIIMPEDIWAYLHGTIAPSMAFSPPLLCMIAI